MSKSSDLRAQKQLERFLTSMPKDVIGSFSKQQVEGIRQALDEVQWKRHGVDIRFTLPLFWQQFYVVFLIGKERRSLERRIAEQVPIWSLANVLLIVGLVSLGMLGALGLYQLKTLSSDVLSPSEIHPTSIPYVDNRLECDKSGRLWQDDECIDFEHSPTF